MFDVRVQHWLYNTQIYVNNVALIKWIGARISSDVFVYCKIHCSPIYCSLLHRKSIK